MSSLSHLEFILRIMCAKYEYASFYVFNFEDTVENSFDRKFAYVIEMLYHLNVFFSN